MADSVLKNPGKASEPWFGMVADLMVSEDLTFGEAVIQAGIEGYSALQLANFQRRKAFQEVLRDARNRFYTDLAQDPIRSKDVLIGQMVLCVTRLIAQEKWEAALEGGLKLARVQGWLDATGRQNQPEVALTQEAIDQAKQLLMTNREVYKDLKDVATRSKAN